MKYRSVTYLLTGLIVGITAFAQSDEWRSLMNRGNDLWQAGNAGEALVPYRAALRLAEQSGSEPLRVASALNGIATAEDDLDRLSDAEQHFRRALDIVERAAGKMSVSRAQVLVNLSGVYARRGQSPEAEAMLREAIALYSELVPGDNLQAAIARSCLAEALLRRGDYKAAESLVTDSLAVFENKSEPRQGYVGMGYNNLGTVRRFQGRDKEALQLFDRALARLEADMGPTHPVLIYVLNNQASEYVRVGRIGEALPVFRRALSIAESHLGTAHPLYGTILGNYSQSLKKSGHKAEAKELEARAHAVLQDSARRNGSGATVDVSAFRPR